MLRHQRTREVYDLVISDMTMPVMDGLTLMHELRRRQVTVPAIIYTGYGAMHPNLNHQAIQAGVMAVLDKPIELRRVEALLNEVAARRGGTATSRRHSSSAEQPFFGTARVARPSSTRVERRDPDPAAQNSTGALERRRSEVGYAGDALVPQTPQLPPLPMPAPSPLPFPADITPVPHMLQAMPPIRTPLPGATEPRNDALIPPTPLRTPLPVALPPTGQPLTGQPLASLPPTGRPSTFQTPIPGAPRAGGFHRPASMRTPLPFLIQPSVPPLYPASPPTV